MHRFAAPCFVLSLLAACGSSACPEGTVSEGGVCVRLEADAGAGSDAGIDASSPDAGDPCASCSASQHCVNSACVDCRTNTDCPDTAPVCSNGVCGNCGASSDCTGRVSGGVCGAKGACVACAAGQTAACSMGVCKPDGKCSGYGLNRTDCLPCDTDQNCGGGRLCVPMTFMAKPHGSYCLLPSVGASARPYTTKLSSRTSADGITSEFFGIDESMTTCEAVNALHVAFQACPTGLDNECPAGGLCRTVGAIGNQCTYPCGADSGRCPALPAGRSSCGPGTGAIDYCGG